MTSEPKTVPTKNMPGRPIVLTPTPQGLWLVVCGGVIAALGPLFGFLIGSMMGDTTIGGDLSPIYLFLFIGIIVGGFGVAMALVGLRRLWRAHPLF